MQQWYQCPRCGKNILYGANPCPYCKCSLAWSQQGPVQYLPPAAQPEPAYQPQQTPQYQQQYQQPKPPKKKSNKLGIIALAVVLVALAAVGSCVVCTMAPSSTKATTPAEVISKVKVGMTIDDVMGIVDVDKFTAEKAFVVVSCSSLSFNNDIIDYEATKDMDSPYFMWLCFGSVVQNLNPAIIGFSANPEMVIGTGRMDFAEAQALVEWNSGRPFRR